MGGKDREDGRWGCCARYLGIEVEVTAVGHRCRLDAWRVPMMDPLVVGSNYLVSNLLLTFV